METIKKKISPLLFLIFFIIDLFLPFFSIAQTVNLTVTSGCTGSQAFANLTWTSDILGSPTYYVLRKIEGAAEFTQIGVTAETSYLDQTINSDKNYLYQIRAEVGTDKYFSNQALSRAVYCPPTLSPPTTFCQDNGPHIVLNWSQVSGNLSTYEIYRDGIKIGQTLNTTFADGPNLEGTKNYNYFIRAVWQTGITKDSETAPVIALACPPKLSLTSGCNSQSPGGPKINLSWNNLLGVQNYQIYRKAQTEANFSLLKTLTEISYTDNLVESLANYGQGGQISYYLKAIWLTDQKDSSIQQIDIPRCPPYLTVESVCNQSAALYPEMHLSWTTTFGAIHYNIYRNDQFRAQVTTIDYIDYLDPTTDCPNKICTHSYRVDAIVSGFPTFTSNSVTKDIDCSTVTPPSPPPYLNPPTAFCVSGDSRVSLSWTPSDNRVYYTLYRNEVGIINLLETSFIDSGVESNFTYTYRVTAFGRGGTYTDSLNSRTITAYDCAPPSQPTLSLARGCENGKPYLNLSWSETTNTFYYEIYRGTSPAALNLLITFEKGSTEYSLRTWKDTGVLGATTYYYQVAAGGPPGVPSTFSATRSTTTLSCLPTTPTLTLTTACEITNAVVNLSWSTDRANTSRYEIFREDYSTTVPIKIIYDTAVKTWKDTGLVYQTAYKYKVEAVGYGEPPARATEGYKSITTLNCSAPGTFTLNEPTISCQGSYPRADLSWSSSPNASSYNLYRNQLNFDGTIATTTEILSVTSPYGDRGFGNALNFDGGDYVRVPDSSSLDIASKIALEAWIYRKPGDSLYAWRTFISKFEGSRQDLYLTIYYNNLYIALDPVVSYYTNTNISISPGVWTHIAVTFDGSILKVFKNGKLGWSRSGSGTLRLGTNTQSLYIGSNTYWGEYWLGVIDEVRIYNRNLTDTEVEAHYQGTFSNDSGLVGLWRFDEGSGQDISDGSNSGNNGTRGPTTASETSDPTWLKNGPQTETKYSWQAKAISSGGSTLSNITNPNLMPICQPTKPGLTLKPLCQAGAPIVNISWSFAINALNYELYRQDKGLIGTSSQTVNLSGRTIIDNDVLASTTYNYWVRAIGSAGIIESDHLNVTTLSCQGPTPPQNLIATSSCSGGYPRVTLSWSASQNTDYYSIYKNGALLTNTTSTSYTDTVVTVNTTYSYYVVAYGPAGASLPSNTVTINTNYCPPSTPSITLLMTDCENFVPVNNISWSDPTTFNTTAYKIYRSITTTPPTDPIITIDSKMAEFSSRNWKDNLSLSASTIYYYWLRASGPAGESSLSSSKSISTYSCGLVPGTPTLNLNSVSCFENTPQATLSWGAVSNAISYNLYRTNPDLSSSIYPALISPFSDRGSYSLNFDGSNDYVKIPPSGNLSNSLKPANAITVETWIYPTFPSTGYGYMGIVDYLNGYSSNILYLYYSNNNGYLYGYFVLGGYYFYPSYVTISNNTWTHIAYVYDGAKHLLYKNGVAGTPSSASGTIYSSTNPIRIGRYSSYYFKGKIDEFRIYGRALSASEIQKHYQGIYNNESDLRAVWHFEEATGTTAFDSSGNGNNGALTNMDTTTCWVRPTGKPNIVLPLEMKKNYSFRLKSLSADRESNFSNEVSISTPDCFPVKPDLVVTPQCDGANPQLKLSWSPDPNNLTTYWSVYKRREGETLFTNIINISPPTTSYLDGNVESITKYEYYLVAVGKGTSVPSDIASGETPICYEPPTQPVINATPTCYGYSSRIKIEWQKDPTGKTLFYNIWRKNLTEGETDFSQIFSGIPADTTQYVDIVSENNRYLYQVEAVGMGAGNSVFSDPSSEVTSYECSKIPPFPPDLKLNYILSIDHIITVSLNWTEAGNEEEYKVFRRLAGESEFAQINQSWWQRIVKYLFVKTSLAAYENPLTVLEADILNYVDYTGTDGITYEYQIMASNKNGDTLSNIISVFIPVARPGDFTLSVLSQTFDQIVFVWTEALTTEAGGPVTYQVLRDNSSIFSSPTVICSGVTTTTCADNNPTFFERFYKAVATNNGGSTDSNILKAGFPLPIWREVIPW